MKIGERIINLNTTDLVIQKFNCDVKLVWLEILCVKEDFRKNNISKILVDKFIKHVINHIKLIKTLDI